ncbi:hypothetical protein CFN78_25200 [Amycolatopsis antarctica]|uniref:DUF4232 domain-containing protein n=1 Tax=Amycolatopsis antarctica TaxID=1854586 RepID=A0A263CWJ3_9PSEU|nr:DUF4232 domain-containing protein [Amycolatopsis antarctica]OZM70461.1 hypothetical protein CFN78_25200 [Amycolatopsis antarctica]
MASTRTIRFGAAAVVTGAIAAGGLTVAAGSAQAMPTDTNTCLPGEVTAQVTEGVAPVQGEKLFRLTFTAVPGEDCVLTGTPGEVTFHDAAGAPLGVDSFASAPQSAPQEHVDAEHPAEVVLRAPDADLPGAPAASVSFTMPNSGTGLGFRVAWPSPVNGPVEVGNIGAPVG